jgi:hypothetical protein
MRRTYHVSVGQRFEHLVTVSPATHLHRSAWLCMCDCGKTTTVLTYNLARGLSRSCSCRCFAKLNAVARFWSYVDKSGPLPSHMPQLGPCWIWTGATYDSGYGMFGLTDPIRNVRAHRFSWFLEHGSWPTMNVLHHCDTPLCLRPLHLFEGTQQDNWDDMRSKGRHRHGESHQHARITDADILSMRERRLAGESVRAIASSFDIGEGYASKLILGTVRMKD